MGVGTCLVGVPAGAQQAPTSPLPSPPASRCTVSTDPTYGLTAENPVRIGGGPGAMAVRQRQYLDLLRGPAGEVVRYSARGSRMVKLPAGDTIVDSYPLTLEGAQTVTVYLDGYHYAPPLAPKGFVCAQPIALAPPGPDAILAGTSVVELAIEQGATREFEPIQLNAPDGPRVAVMDQFRVLAYLAHLAAKAGAPWDPKRPPTRGGSAIMAYAQQCEGRTVVAREIEIRPPQGPPVPRGDAYLNETTVTTLLPRIELPPSTLVATFGLALLRPLDAVRVVYDSKPCGTTQTVDLPVVATTVRVTANPPARLPAGHPPVTDRVLLQALVDTDGRVQKAVYVGGPEDLIPAALTAIESWRAEPATINGSPVVTPGMIAVPFAP